MLNLALAPVFLVALAGIVFGVRYMRRDAFLPYHAAVAGKSWTELDPGVQIIILGMLKIIGVLNRYPWRDVAMALLCAL